MADRVVRVNLVAQANQFIRDIERAKNATRDAGTEAEKLATKGRAFETVGRAAATMGTVLAAGVGLAVSRFADFDQAMSNVQAATHETAENMGSLRDAALEAGQSTVFTATEAAGAIENLSKAGVSTADILSGGLAGALNLASAGATDVGTASEIAASALTQFNLEGSDMGHVADLLAAGAGKAQGEVADLGAALNQAGLVANQMGLSIEDTTGTLAAFASAGLTGSDAGTSFRTMLLRLANPTGEARQAMEELGLSAYDAQGNFVGMESIAGQLSTSLHGVDQATRDAALATIFGQDAIRGANVLYQQGAQGIADWTSKVDDSGYAAETAALRLDNLSGDVEKLGGAFDTALIQSGSAANETLRFLTQTATDAVDGFNNMPAGVQGASLAVGGLGAAASLAAGGFLLAVPKIAEFNSAVETLGPKAQKGAKAAVALGKGIAIVAAAGAAIQVLDQLGSAGDKAAAGLEATTSALLDNNLEGLFEGLGPDVNSLSEGLELLAGNSLNSNMDRFGSTLNGIFFGGSLADQVGDTRDQFVTLGESLAQLVNSGEGDRAKEMFDEIAAGAEAQGISTEKLMELMPSYQEALSGVSNDQKLAADSADENTAALAELSGQAQNTETDIESLADSIRGFGSAQLDVNAASRDFEAALDSLTESIAENGTTLDRGTEAGRANDAALDDLAKSTLELAAATVTQTGKQEDANGVIAAGREKLIAMLEPFGIVGAEAEAYADKLGLIPGNVATAVAVTGVDAAERALNTLARTRTAYLSAVVTTNAAGETRSNIRTARASGGYISGPGTGTSDSIPAWLSNGEYVIRASAVDKYGAAFFDALNHGRAPGGAYVRGDRVQYANGGLVAAASGVGGPRVVIQEMHNHNPKQLTAQGMTVSALRRVDMELGL